MKGMSREDMRSALDVLNARLKLEFGARLESWDLERGEWSQAGPYVPEYVCELRLAPDGYGMSRILLRSVASPDQDKARLLAWEGLLYLFGFPDASSGEELVLKLSLLPDQDVKNMLRRVAKVEGIRRAPKRRYT